MQPSEVHKTLNTTIAVRPPQVVFYLHEAQHQNIAVRPKHVVFKALSNGLCRQACGEATGLAGPSMYSPNGYTALSNAKHVAT